MALSLPLPLHLSLYMYICLSIYLYLSLSLSLSLSRSLSLALSLSLSFSLSLSLSSRPSGEQCPLPVFRGPCLFSLVCCSLGALQGAPSRVLAMQMCRRWRPHRGHQWRHIPHRMCSGGAALRYRLHLTCGLPGVAISVGRNGLLRDILKRYVVESHVHKSQHKASHCS